MTLDVTSFMTEKGGNPEAIRESQRRRGHPVEAVDEVIKLYSEWVKRESLVVSIGIGYCSDYEPAFLS